MKPLLLLLALTATAFSQVPQQLPIPEAQANKIMEDFAKSYSVTGKPKIMVYINRSLVKPLPVVTQDSSFNRTVNNDGDYGSNQRSIQQSTTTVQTPDAMDPGVSRLSAYDDRQLQADFSARLIQCGVRLVDQQIASQLDRQSMSVNRYGVEVEAPGSDVNAVRANADMVLEVLAKERRVVIPTPAGNEGRCVYEISATLLSVRNPGQIVAQVTSRSLYKPTGPKTLQDRRTQDILVSQLDPEDVLDQVCLLVMQDYVSRISLN